ncbi:hypothetical protein PFY12_03060 [Chryseobacterium camelliae]|uniref:Uncharacterized protein n=1 Tax=Chryseobacterium camelliae TaxID=1265445 RepID=A0ABY7QPH7_9FLAO|nr:hypothetical protein [Chryseobacterium camelliae]WBV61108.1 hypothetical protein PFY12_03060 [Chryseobacterium camelliae]
MIFLRLKNRLNKKDFAPLLISNKPILTSSDIVRESFGKSSIFPKNSRSSPEGDPKKWRRIPVKNRQDFPTSVIAFAGA